jgi:hypothetical protein
MKMLFTMFVLVGSFTYGYADSFPANHCEGFIDKARPIFFSQVDRKVLKLYIKTLEERMDSPVRAVVFRGNHVLCLSCNVSESGGAAGVQPYDTSATRFVGSRDYFELEIPVAGTDSQRNAIRETVGRIVVISMFGTEYILPNSEGGLIHSFTSNTAYALVSVYSVIAKNPSSVGGVPKTADFGSVGGELSRKLNPHSCR